MESFRLEVGQDGCMEALGLSNQCWAARESNGKKGWVGREARKGWGMENWRGVRQEDIGAWNNEQPIHGHNTADLLGVMQGVGLKRGQLWSKDGDGRCHMIKHATSLWLTELHGWKLPAFLDDPFGYHSLVSPWPPGRKELQVFSSASTKFSIII